MWMLDYKILDILGCAIGTAVVRDNNLKVGKCLGSYGFQTFYNKFFRVICWDKNRDEYRHYFFNRFK